LYIYKRIAATASCTASWVRAGIEAGLWGVGIVAAYRPISVGRGTRFSWSIVVIVSICIPLALIPPRGSREVTTPVIVVRHIVSYLWSETKAAFNCFMKRAASLNKYPGNAIIVQSESASGNDPELPTFSGNLQKGPPTFFH